MRRFLAAAGLVLFCVVGVWASCVWADGQLTLWEDMLERTSEAALRDDSREAARLVEELNASLQEERFALSLLFRKDFVSNLEGQFKGLEMYLSPHTEEDLNNAIHQSQVQLRLFRDLFFGVL